jgi:hypothetical protein
MKTIFLFLGMLLATYGLLNAQKLQLAPFAGYTFADKFRIDRGDARIGDGFTYGGTLSYMFRNSTSVGLTYSRQDCDFYAFSDYHDIDVDGEISANYIFIGANEMYNVTSELALFAGSNVGMAVYSGKTRDLDTKKTHFAVGFNLGMDYFFTEKTGIRLQGNLNFPITNLDAVFWWGSGGSSVGVSSRVPFLQFGLLGGLVFNLN